VKYLLCSTKKKRLVNGHTFFLGRCTHSSATLPPSTLLRDGDVQIFKRSANLDWEISKWTVLSSGVCDVNWLTPSLVAIACDDGDVHLLDVAGDLTPMEADCASRTILTGHTDSVVRVRTQAGGTNQFVTASLDRTVRLWDAKSHHTLATFESKSLASLKPTVLLLLSYLFIYLFVYILSFGSFLCFFLVSISAESN
jgi:WD40 repeat protein